MEEKREAIKHVVENTEPREEILPASGLKIKYRSYGNTFLVDGRDCLSSEYRAYLKLKEVEALYRQAEAQERQAKAMEKLVELEKQKQKEKEPEKKYELPIADSWIGGV